MADILQYQEGTAKTAGHVKQVIVDADGHEYVDFAALTAAMLPTHAHSGAADGGSALLPATVKVSTYLWVGSYAAIGFAAAPANTTAGDLTASRIRLGTDAAFTNSFIFQVAHTITSASVNARGLGGTFTFNGAGAGAGGWSFATTHTPSASASAVYGAVVVSQWNPPTGVTITDAYNLWVQSQTGNDVGAVTTGRAIFIAAPSLGSLKPATLRGLAVANQGATGVGTSEAIYIDAQTGSTANWDIYHAGTAPNIAIGNTGTLTWKDTAGNTLMSLADKGTTGALTVTDAMSATSYMVAGNQVVGARVIDARIDDAIGGTFGATEQGILDACRDALITHGLVAAA